MKYARARASFESDGEADPGNSLRRDTIVPSQRRRDSATEPPSTFEELAGTGPVPVTGHADRWLGFSIAVAAAVLSFGFAGHALEASTAGTSQVASATPPTLQLAAPATAAPLAAFVLVSPAGSEPTDGWFAQAPGIASVSFATDQSRGSVALLVVGYAPSTIDPLTIEVRTLSGALLASAVARRSVDDERPGSDGGPRYGLATFHQRILVPGPVPSGGWQVEIAWRDESHGPSGSATLSVAAVAH